MSRIRKNTTIELQTKKTSVNAIGEQVESFETVETLEGWLDSTGGDSKYSTYNAKIQESTNVFICDYKELGLNIKSENSRVFEPKKGLYYDVMLIDDPCELHKQLEIYLKFTGGQIG